MHRMGTGEARQHRHARSATRRRLATAGLALALIGAGAACGGGAPKTAAVAVAAADGTTTTTEAGAAYTACLKDHGVDLPDRPRNIDGTGNTGGTGGPPSSRPPGSRPSTSFPPGSRPSTSLPPGVDQAKVAAARLACESLQPANRGANGPQGQAFQAYASCMKDHGVTVAGGGPGGGPGGPDREDPAFKAADAICAPLRPAQP
jgi:hypothetical protein